MVIYLKLFLTALFWGGTFMAARVVAQHVDPYSASFLRFFMASALLIALIIRKEGRIPRLQRHQVIPAVLLGMTGVFAYNIFFFLGMKTITASRASLIVASNPVFISLLSTLFFRERLNAGGGGHPPVPDRSDDRHLPGRSPFDLRRGRRVGRRCTSSAASQAGSPTPSSARSS